MISFNIGRLQFPENGVTSYSEALLGIEADIQIRADGVLVYEELDFSVVELASGLAQWLRDEPWGDFVFRSMETVEIGIVKIMRSTSGWIVDSVHRSAPDPREHSSAEVASAIREYTAEVLGRCRAAGVDLLPWLPELEIG